MLEVVIVTVPEASATQKLGASHALLTDKEVLAGMVDALMYWTRMMSSLQTCTLNRPDPTVKVTPFASTAKDPPVGGGVRQVTAVDPPAPAPARDAPPLPAPPIAVVPPSEVFPLEPPPAPKPRTPPIPVVPEVVADPPVVVLDAPPLPFDPPRPRSPPWLDGPPPFEL